MLGAVTSPGPGPAAPTLLPWRGNEQIPGHRGRGKENLCPRPNHRQNNLSNYKVAFYFFFQRLREIPDETLPSGLQSPCTGAVQRGCSVTENRGQRLFIV